ncbi:CASP-like protein 4D1 [Bidens hawaiensis]|uniref:CASP-like protein 4D1 n=1 Tax=Bidens hawaiensis TaxID=980011 RepID=UPI00404A1271
MAVKVIAYTTLVLRILTLMLLVASAVYMVCNNYKLAGDKTTWKDIKTYRFVFAATVIGAVYSLIQLPFAFYYACNGKRMIRHPCLPQFEFYADKLISYVLATAVGAGFAASMELKEVVDSVVALLSLILIAVGSGINLGFDIDQFHSKVDKFLDRGIIATVLLTLGFACMAVISVLSSLQRPHERKYFG